MFSLLNIWQFRLRVLCDGLFQFPISRTLAVANNANIVCYFHCENSQLLSIIQFYNSNLFPVNYFIVFSEQIFWMTEIVNLFEKKGQNLLPNLEVE